MDEERTVTDAPDDSSASPATPASGARLGEPRQQVDYDTVMRANRRRLALIGLATGGVMSLIVLLCVLLLILLSSQ